MQSNAVLAKGNAISWDKFERRIFALGSGYRILFMRKMWKIWCFLEEILGKYKGTLGTNFGQLKKNKFLIKF